MAAFLHRLLVRCSACGPCCRGYCSSAWLLPEASFQDQRFLEWSTIAMLPSVVVICLPCCFLRVLLPLHCPIDASGTYLENPVISHCVEFISLSTYRCALRSCWVVRSLPCASISVSVAMSCALAATISGSLRCTCSTSFL